MVNFMKVSVCMATYNGAAYIKRQINSILVQLKTCDEIIIVDDNSTDNTCELIDSFQDSRIKLLKNETNKGFLFSFQKAIKYSCGDIIFLSDQDDEWMEDKVLSVLLLFEEKNFDIVLHDAVVVNKNGRILYNSLKEIFPMKTGVIVNFVKNSFTGCCMALKRKIALKMLPIPDGVKYHDRWFGIVGGVLGYKIYYLDKILIKYYRHGHNTSPFKHNNIHTIIKDRLLLILNIIIFLNCGCEDFK